MTDVTRQVLEHATDISLLAFSGDSRLLVVASRGSDTGYCPPGCKLSLVHTPGIAVVWDAAGGVEQCRLENIDFNSIDFRPESHTLAVATGHGVRLWDAATGQPAEPLLDRERDGLDVCTEGLVFSPDGRRLAITSWGGFEGADVVILDSESGVRVGGLSKPDDSREVLTVRFVEAGTRLEGRSYQYDNSDRAYLWDLASGEMIAYFTGHDECEGCECSPSGKLLATATRTEPVVYLWRLGSPDAEGHLDWDLAHRLPRRPTAAFRMPQLAFSADEATVAVLSADAFDPDNMAASRYSVALWDTKSGQEAGRLPVAGKAYGIRFSPDGHTLAVVSGEVSDWGRNDACEYVLTLWQVPSGHCLASLSAQSRRTNGHYHCPSEHRAPLFSPDGRQIAVSYDRHVELWDISPITGV